MAALFASLLDLDADQEDAMVHVCVVVTVHFLKQLFNRELEHSDSANRSLATMGNYLKDVVGVCVVRLDLAFVQFLLYLTKTLAGDVEG